MPPKSAFVHLVAFDLRGSYFGFMCGLYSFRKAPEETRTLFNYLEQPNFPPRQYVTPGSPIAIVTQGSGSRHFNLVRWGFIPSWTKELKPGKPLINARSETIAEKPSFRNAFRRRRCLIPADGFYEWEGDVPGQKRPYFIRRPDDRLFAFAGIWEHWLSPDGSEIDTAAIVTTEPNTEIARIHDRSPVVIHPEHFDIWLANDETDLSDAQRLLRPPPDDYFMLEQTRIERKAPAAKPKKDGDVKDKQQSLF
jgi:putative SOS response-associated peptidase YedK